LFSRVTLTPAFPAAWYQIQHGSDHRWESAGGRFETWDIGLHLVHAYLSSWVTIPVASESGCSFYFYFFYFNSCGTIPPLCFPRGSGWRLGVGSFRVRLTSQMASGEHSWLLDYGRWSRGFRPRFKRYTCDQRRVVGWALAYGVAMAFVYHNGAQRMVARTREIRRGVRRSLFFWDNYIVIRIRGTPNIVLQERAREGSNNERAVPVRQQGFVAAWSKMEGLKREKARKGSYRV